MFWSKAIIRTTKICQKRNENALTVEDRCSVIRMSSDKKWANFRHGEKRKLRINITKRKSARVLEWENVCFVRQVNLTRSSKFARVLDAFRVDALYHNRFRRCAFFIQQNEKKEFISMRENSSVCYGDPTTITDRNVKEKENDFFMNLFETPCSDRKTSI